jgi:hypothetical protein
MGVQAIEIEYFWQRRSLVVRGTLEVGAAMNGMTCCEADWWLVFCEFVRRS